MWEKTHTLAPVGGIAHTPLAILRAEVCMKKGSRKRKDRVQEAVAAMANPLVDPMGTYTGVPAEEGERPLQDADDL